MISASVSNEVQVDQFIKRPDVSIHFLNLVPDFAAGLPNQTFRVSKSKSGSRHWAAKGTGPPKTLLVTREHPATASNKLRQKPAPVLKLFWPALNKQHLEGRLFKCAARSLRRGPESVGPHTTAFPETELLFQHYGSAYRPPTTLEHIFPFLLV